MDHKEYTIQGVKVLFPCKPYPCQFSMMDRIVRGIERQQNCLLESPTGSGKSLALLCSALAWQRAEYEKLKKDQLEKDILSESGYCCSCKKEVGCAGSNPSTSSAQPAGPVASSTKMIPSSSMIRQQTDSQDIGAADESFDDEFEDDFQQPRKRYRTPSRNQPNPRLPLQIAYEGDPPSRDGPVPASNTGPDQSNESGGKAEKCCTCQDSEKGKTPRKRVPRIYFGTRTHKQITQIVRELGKTAYADTHMLILASRQHTCIHPEISRVAAKNEGCRDLLDGPGCRFFDNAKKIVSQNQIRHYGLDSAWDIEDLVAMCKKKKACPYFVSRNLKEQADIIFCPYNYLIDPIVRNMMEINIKGQIIILDEGHNIEDSAREAASESISQDLLQKAAAELQAMTESNIKPMEHFQVKKVCVNLSRLIEDTSSSLEQRDFEQACKIWSSFDIIARFDNLEIGPKHFPMLMKCYKTICEDSEEKENKKDKDRVSSSAMTTLEHLFVVLGNMYKEDLKYMEDYRVAVVRKMTYNTTNSTDGAWLNPRRSRGGQQTVPVQVFTLNFWCMNPAVSFSDFAAARNVILTSGTLSPMDSFQSELGIPFPIQLETSHVIQDSQVWVGAIGSGPSGSALHAVYKNTETFQFQDELGMLVLNVCMTIPHGVLCFFPSYKLLEKVSGRWKSTGLWDKLLKRKKVIAEPRASEKVDFEEIMKVFYRVIENSGNSENNDDADDETDGALFLAVCRGKVSEGLDFADNNARAVITVGIPYPNFKDLQVELKRKYNDQHRSARGLLSGSDWYEIQAFRALNQALGRCIRHRNDWGALILVDERFVKNAKKYCKGLSKWLRNKAQPFGSYHLAMNSLSTFNTNRLKIASEAETSTLNATLDSSISAMKTSTSTVKTQRRKGHDGLHDSSNISSAAKTDDVISDSPPLEKSISKSNRSPVMSHSMITEYFGQPKSKSTPRSNEKIGSGKKQSLARKIWEQKNRNKKAISEGQKGLSSARSPVTVSHTEDAQQSDGRKSDMCHGDDAKETEDRSGELTMLVNNLNSNYKIGDIKMRNSINKKINGLLYPDKSDVSEPAHNATEQCSEEDIKTFSGSGKFFKFCQLPTPIKSQVADKANDSACGNNASAISTDSEFRSESAVGDQEQQEFDCTPPLFDAEDDDIAADALSVSKLNCSLEKNREKTIEGKSHRDIEQSKLGKLSSEAKDDETKSIRDNAMSSSKTTVNKKRNVRGKSLFVERLHDLSAETESSKMETPHGDVDIKTSSKSTNQNEADVITGPSGAWGTLQDDVEDEEDFMDTLNTKRNMRGWKRRSLSKSNHPRKRMKGVEYLEEADEEQKTETEKITCAQCGSVLVDDTRGYEKRKRIPDFIKKITSEKCPETIFFFSLAHDSRFSILNQNLQGISLNSFWDRDLFCCVEFLQCSNCTQQETSMSPLLGARILWTGKECTELKPNQAWLLSSVAKLSR